MSTYALIELCKEHKYRCIVVGGVHMEKLNHSWVSPDYCISHFSYCDQQKEAEIKTIDILEKL